MQGQALLEQGRPAEAQAFLDANGDADDPATQLVRADAAAKAGDYETAITVLRNELRRPLKPGVEQWALANLAAAQRAQGRLEDAYATMQRLETLQPDSVEVQRVLGAIAFEQGQDELSRLHFGRLTDEERALIEGTLGRDFFAIQAP